MQKKNSETKRGWSTPDSIKAYLQSKWDKGVFLIAEYSDAFPLHMAIKSPSASEITEHYSEVLQWIHLFESHRQSRSIEVVWEERSHRLSGKNHFPNKILIPNAESLADFVERSSEWKSWKSALTMVQDSLPELIPYWQTNASKCFPYSQDLEKLKKLLNVCIWCCKYIPSQTEKLYIRQIPVEGVHTKFIESNKAILASWIDFLVPPHLVNSGFSKGADFAKRYGFLDKPQQVRMRILDPKYYLHGLSDLTVVASELAQLDMDVQNVFICENNVTCLSFPMIPNSILIFGAGYGFDALAKIPWLRSKQIFYWGDLDSNGFCILDQLKSHFPHVQSFLMDEKTLLSNKEFWSREDCPSCRKLTNLNQAEHDTYQGLCNQNWGDHVRLEQELIPMSSVNAILCDMGFNLKV